jgi:hypothetical protein
MVTIYHTRSQSPGRGKVLCLLGVLVLCVAGGIWGFRTSRRSGGENLEAFGIIVMPQTAAEPEIIVDEATFAHIEPSQRQAYLTQALWVQKYKNPVSHGRMGFPAVQQR